MDTSSTALIAALDDAHRATGAAHRRFLDLIVEVDLCEAWRGDGARDIAHWLWMRYGLSNWKARRWIAAAHALVLLPRTAKALTTGELGIDKVVELTRFATPEAEADLVQWARAVSCGAIRRRGDLAARSAETDAAEVERDRRLHWWYFDEGRRFGLEAELPASHGAAVAKAIERAMDDVPVMPDEDATIDVAARRADALVGLCTERLAADPDPDRATIVVHTTAEALASGRAAEVEGSPPIHGSTLERLACTARVQAVVESSDGNARPGPVLRQPPAWMLRQLRHRDRECRFPGCGARRFVQAHHVRFWRDGGTTTLDNLVLICSFHHKLVHEHGWRLSFDGGRPRWFRPDGSGYRAGPAPPEDPPLPAALGQPGFELVDLLPLHGVAQAV